MSGQSPVSIAGPSIEDAADLLRSVAHPLLASLSSHQAELDSLSAVPLETQHAQQQLAAHSNGSGNSSEHRDATDAANGVQLSVAEPIKLQIQV